MSLTKTEMEAKIADLEDRVSLLSETTDSLEGRLQDGIERWAHCAAEVRGALGSFSRQLERLRRKLAV